jgi:hypothetical protein
MINDSDDVVFPHNVTDVIAFRLSQIIDTSFPVEDRVQVFMRPLRSTDPMQCIGVSAVSGTPDPRSQEMRTIGGLSSIEPTVARYTYAVQAMVVDGDEELGMKYHAILATRVKMVLLRDQVLHDALVSLSVAFGGVTERLKRFGCEDIRYINHEIGGSYHYVATLFLWIETENGL